MGDYAEPWTEGSECAFDSRRRAVLGYMRQSSRVQLSRAVACVNACAGMEDPGAELESLRAKVHELTLELSQEAFGRGVAEARAEKAEEDARRLLEAAERFRIDEGYYCRKGCHGDCSACGVVEAIDAAMASERGEGEG